MPLLVGSRFGSFEVRAPLGQGGMGEVYRARDLKLARDVAIKVLPSAVAADPNRLARFGREAHILASLNHPHIAQIYGLEEMDGVRALVMELVEGPTLADSIIRGIPVPEALSLAQQIAGALEAAHDRGIIHRDLKPANIKVRPDGAVKVLDFGLAKALDDPAEALSGHAAMSTTMAGHSTQVGIVLGTAAYMSPEQATGNVTDRRTDLWAFGVVLLEMLTGRPAFTGETVSEVLASVLKNDPDWAALPRDTPAPIRRLLRRCLEKDRRRRLDSAADARLEIEEALSPPERDADSPLPPSRRLSPVTIASLLAGGALAAALVTWVAMRQPQLPQASPIRFMVTMPAAQSLRIGQNEGSIALSPDGRQFVYVTRPNTGTRTAGTGGALMVRPLDRIEARPVVPFGRNPFFSPDGDWIGYFDDNEFVLKKVPLSGASPVNICRFVGGPRGASWSEDNTMVFATGDPTTGLWRVPAGGGEPVLLTKPDAAQPLRDHLFPSVLPGGRGVLFTIAEPGRPEDAEVAVLDVKTGQHRILIRGGSQARYVDSGHLVYAARGTLRAVRFDLDKLEVAGEALPVVENVMMTPISGAHYDVSAHGTLAYLSSDAPETLPLRSPEWIDRAGRRQPLKAPIRAYASARVSPDGKRVALHVRDQENDIWIWDFARETMHKLTHGPAVDQNPVWTLDSRYLIFASDRGGQVNLYMQAADGSEPIRRLTNSHMSQWPTAITPDGITILGHEFGASTSFDLFLFRFGDVLRVQSRGDSPPLPADSRRESLLQDAVAQTLPTMSPDGRYLAYQSNESGRFEIYVRPFPDVKRGKWQVSTEGGSRPVWAKNAAELFYADASQTLVAVPVETSDATFAWGKPIKLVENAADDSINLRSYDIAPDGRRFLILRDQSSGRIDTAGPQIVVVVNWLEELKMKLAGRGSATK